MKSFVFGLLFALISSAYGKTCQLENNLTEGQLKALNKASRINRVLLNSSMLGKNVYEIKLLTNKDDGQMLVLLGEAHIKGPRSSKLGKNLVEAFKMRMLEGVPKPEIDYISANIPALSNSLGWQRSLMKLLTFNFYGSSISEAREDGLTFLPGFNLVTYNNKAVANEDTGSVASVVSLLQRLGDYNQKGINLPLETGAFIKPAADDSYLLEARNLRMANNIVTYLKALELEAPVLIMVGSAHIKGLTELLRQQGHVPCDNF